MSSQTKMIIITSDEDIIRQFVDNKNPNTQIIPMDNKQMTSINKNDDNNRINLNLLNQSKPIKKRKKSLDLICTICGDCAIGYNYGVLSCASCKAFFHRNGQQDLKRFKCLTGHGQCIIEYKISRKCYRCRLERCFNMGMRKDLILSQKEIQRRKDLGRNRNISSTNVLPTFDEIEDEMESLTAEDLIVIQRIESSFLSIFQNDSEEFTNLIDLSSTHDSELICCLQYNNEIALHLIKFCRVIGEFENLDVDDRFTIIKYNLLPLLLFCILTCHCHTPAETNDCSLNIESEEEEEEEKRLIYILCNQSNYLYEMVVNLRVTLAEIVEQDYVLLSLLLTIFLFAKGLSMNENEPSLKDSLSVYRIQSYYTKLLWNYMIKKQGEIKTCKHFTKLLTAIFRTQSAAVRFREYLSSQMTTLDAVDEIAPLMQTILHIS